MRGNALAQVPIVDLDDHGHAVTTFLSWPTVDVQLADLARIAIEGSLDAEIVALAQELEGPEDAHRFRLSTIGFRDKEEQIVQTPRYTLAIGSGDCVDHALEGAALYEAMGYDWSLVPMGRDPLQPSHLSLVVGSRLSSRARAIVPLCWRPLRGGKPLPAGRLWSDTSVQPLAGCATREDGARLGEHPADATDRLKLECERPELGIL